MPPEASFSQSISAEAWLSLGSMEGIHDLPVVPKKPAAATARARVPRLKATIECLPVAAVAGAAYLVHYLPVAPFQVTGEFGVRRPISASIIAILAGALLRNLTPTPAPLVEGAKRVVRTMLPAAIILTGAGLNLAVVGHAGAVALGITVASMLTAAAAAWQAGKWLGVRPRTSLLIGAGTAVCGASAIVAIAPLVGADEEDLTLSMTTVSLMGLILMFVLPLAGAALALDDRAFGIWAGASIHSVPQVVAAAFTYSAPAGAMATMVKLVRVALLAPLVFALAINSVRHRGHAEVTIHYARLLPPFLWGFFALSLVATLGLIPALDFPSGLRVPLTPVLSESANLLLTLVMAAIGLEVNLRLLLGAGARALGAGAIAAIVLGAVSLALVRWLA